eukprot:08613.XXX_287334_271768_1 [CDS] Oithona nana genome sequencing.
MINAKIIISLFMASFKVVEPVEENMASPDFHSVKQFDAYVPSVQDNHFYVDPFGFSTTPDVTPTPSIDLTTPKNVTVIKGKTAMLACVVRDVGKAAVSWMRLRDINLLAINEVTNTKDKRIKAIHVPDSDRWSLRIQDTKLSDDGAYECQVTTDIQTATIVHLKVLDPLTEISGPSEVFLSKGSTLNLTCIIQNGPVSQPYIIWTHNSKMLRYVGNNDDNMIASVGSDGKVLISTRIVVTNTDVQHSGTYKCEPGSAPVASVNVHVLDGKLPAAMQTAGVGSHLHKWLSLLVGLHIAYCIRYST